MYQTESNQIVSINRVENTVVQVGLYPPPVNNMIKIIKSYLIDKTRPEKYTPL